MVTFLAAIKESLVDRKSLNCPARDACAATSPAASASNRAMSAFCVIKSYKSMLVSGLANALIDKWTSLLTP